MAPNDQPAATPGSTKPSGGGSTEFQLRKYLLLLATLVATVTYVAGLNLPGGAWQEDTPDGLHHAGDPILQFAHHRRYLAFYYCNATAFAASLVVSLLLLVLNGKNTGWEALLRVVMVLDLLGLMGAYAAGSCRDTFTTIYSAVLVCAVFAYIVVAFSTYVVSNKSVLAMVLPTKKDGEEDTERQAGGKHGEDGADSKQEHEEELREVLMLLATFAIAITNTQHDDAVEKARSLVMLLATLVVSITYQAGLDPPGGLWPADGPDYKNGDPILLTTHPTRYTVFFYSNSAAFVASLIVIIMVQSRFLLKRHTLEAAMILDLFGLISAYAAGSCRDEITSIYVVALAGIVLVYVVIHIVFFTLDHKDNHRDAEKLENRREVLLLLAILAATLTYQAGLTPPGGFWSDNEAGHRAGYPVLGDNYRPRYHAFFYCNAASFMASVALIVLLVNPNLYRPGIRCYALYVCMVVGMFGLMGAYAAGSSRDLRTSIYVLTLVVAVFAFVALEVFIFWVYPYLKKILSKSGDKEKESSGSITEEQKTGPRNAATPKTPEAQKEKNMREYLMLLGVLAASVTYQSGLKPPGGLWQDSNGHSSGNPILHDINKGRYYAFFYSNSTSFMASIVVVILLLPWTLHEHKLPLWPMQTAILLDMLGLLAAYAAGSTRDWGTSRNVIYLVIPVLAYIAAYAAVSIYRKKRCHKSQEEA
ncbi:hypothetical protein HU200_060150 [Digitaria exilis]|uniref:PGG domain-containing protein n=1 Tax=Digitaria exilis TaxID=1010633 RepID=A0A835DZ61_9POAL|nr:hypothetical protein HU200_060150 [Digitaria exilis]